MWVLIRVINTDWVQYMLDEKPCDPDYWNPDLLNILIYRTFFRYPKLCGKVGFYCSIDPWLEKESQIKPFLGMNSVQFNNIVTNYPHKWSLNIWRNTSDDSQHQCF